MNQEAAGNEEPKVWLGEDGIVYLYLGGQFCREGVKD